MIDIIAWYLAITVFGLIAWPMLFRLLPDLPDRGYTFSRAAGLLFTGYLFWLLGSLGFLANSTGGIIFCMLTVAGIAFWVYRSQVDGKSMSSWLANHLSMVAVAEALFAIAFIAWAVFRAYNPDIAGTEKPMELTFLNGIRTSPIFPPQDPWLSGYAISYYYFGYVLIAIIADITNTISSIAFNLGLAMIFALTLLGSYGVVYNLVGSWGVNRRSLSLEHSSGWALSSLLGPVFVGIIGNLAGFLELIRALKLPFVGQNFWSWIDLEDLADPIAARLWPPDTWRYWWWWRASRVVRDRDIAGNAIGLQPIDEFPFFSFLLGDMHPHVLALPFVLIALVLAYNALLQSDQLRRSQLVLYTICFGALAFLNTWDLPIYLFILVGAVSLREIRQRHVFEIQDLIRPILTGAGILGAGIIAYLPWYISFRSQAGGILPNAIFATRLHQFTIMFGLFLTICLWFVISRAFRHSRHMNWPLAATLGISLLLILILLVVVLGTMAMRIDPGVRAFAASSIDPTFAGKPDSEISAALPGLMGQVISYRLAHPLTPILLIGLIIIALAAMLPRVPVSGEPTKANIDPTIGFTMLLILTGTLLTLGPEFLYLRDVFGQRLNTVFKFYYAAWVLWAVASAFAVHEIIAKAKPVPRGIFVGMLTILLGASLVYPAFATPAKGNGFVETKHLPTLDGIDYIRRSYPGDYKGIQWLHQNALPTEIVLEAVGGQYSYYGRVSMSTGLATVIGWPGHERQWRGDTFAIAAGSREQDVKEIYNTPNVQRAKDILSAYRVTYIFVGSLERDPGYASPAGIQKFGRYFPVVFQDENMTIYRADQPLSEGTP